MNGIFWQGLFLNTRLDGIGEVVERALGTEGLWSPGPWRQRVELPLQVGGKEASQGGLYAWWAHGVSSRMQAYVPLKSFLLGAVHSHPEIRLGELCRKEKTNYIKGRDSHSANKVQGRHPKTHSVDTLSVIHNSRKHGHIYWEGGNP